MELTIQKLLVAKLNTVRMSISLAVNLDWELNQYDIKNAILNGESEEEIYMQIPPGYENNMNKNKVRRYYYNRES